MKSTSHPAFILAMTGTALILVGLVAMPHIELGTYLLYAGFLIAGIFWLWSIWDVVIANDLRLYQKMFWLIVTISVPVMGGSLFYIMHQKRNRIIT